MRMRAGDEALRSRWIHHFHNPYKPSFNIKSGKKKSTVRLLLRRKIDRFNMIHHERSWMNRKSMHAKMCYNLPSVSNSACMVRQILSFELFRTPPLCSEYTMVSWNYTLSSETTFVHTRKNQKNAQDLCGGQVSRVVLEASRRKQNETLFQLHDSRFEPRRNGVSWLLLT